MNEPLLWVCMFGANNSKLWPGYVENMLDMGRLGPMVNDERMVEALIEYNRDVADGHERLRRVYHSAGKRWLRFLNTPRERT